MQEQQSTDDRIAILPPDLEAKTKTIIGAAFEVANHLGDGLAEAAYHRAMLIELADRGLTTATEVSVPLNYKGRSIGTYRADLVVGDSVVVEMKCAEAISDAHRRQVFNYLKGLALPVGLVINFRGARVQVKRVLNGNFLRERKNP